MPTHGDYPWERDERRRRERGRPAGARSRAAGIRQWVCAFILCAAGGFVVFQDKILPPPQAPALPPRPGVDDIVRPRETPRRPRRGRLPSARVESLHSRWSGPRTLEVWGRATGPSGSTITVRASADGRRRTLGIAPAVEGRFYLRARVPQPLQGRRIRIFARVAAE